MDKAKQLERRMRDGYERIQQGIAAGADVAAWESFWIDLLREYEEVCDGLTEKAQKVTEKVTNLPPDTPPPPR